MLSRPAVLLAALSLLLIFPLASQAVTANASPLEVQFRAVPVPQSSVPAIAQDKAGFIWVATSKGLTRYDGYRLRPIEASAGPGMAQRNLGWVRAMAPAKDGRMWIGTEFLGLAAFDPVHDRVEAHGSWESAKGKPAPIRALAEDPASGEIWVGSVGQGLHRYTPATRRFEVQDLRWHGEPESRVLALAVARVGAGSGTVWAGHWRGLSRLRKGGASWEALALPGLEQGGGTTVLALAEGADGRLWFGTQDGRLGVVEGDGRVRWALTDLRMPVQALADAGEGRLWVGTKVGLLWVDQASGEIQARLRHDPRRTTGLAGNDISSLLRDRDGAMWVAGYGLGLQRHQQHPALAVRGPDADPASPFAEADVRALLALRGGEVLAPTQQGQVVRLDGRPGGDLATLGNWPRPGGAAGNAVVETMSEAPDGSVWLAAAGRLEHRTAEGRLLRDWALDGGRAQRLLLRPSGELWLGMQEGLYRLAGPTAAAPERMHPAGAPLHGGVYTIVEEPRGGRLWIGGQQGLFSVDGKSGVLAPVAQSPAESLASPIVIGLLIGRDGTLWLDTPIAGLHRLRGWDAQGRARFERIGERHGTDGVFGGNLHEDARGRIWSQLYVYDPKADRIDAFGPAEGAAFGSFWFFASTELPDGRLLFGGSRGLLRVSPEAFEPPPNRVPLVISAVRVDGQPYDQAEGLAEGLRLPPGTRTVGVEFAGLDYADPSRLRYQYRIQGLDRDWTPLDASSRSPSFGPLRPGHYTLEVRASAHPTQWGETQLSLPIDWQPAWWQTLWAQAAGVGLLLLAVSAWVQWRTRQLRAREAQLQALVDERTAELREASLTDTLTGLRNRRYLDLRLPEDLRLTLRRHESDWPPPVDADLVVMLLDLDHFKRINDAHGHAAGDAVLVQLAERLRRVFRETDSLVRWGGEEVLAVVRGTRREDAAELAARVCAAVRDQPFAVEGLSLPVTVSMGFCAFPLDRQSPRTWEWSACLALADSALYAAKARGRDGFVGAVEAEGLLPDEAPRQPSAWDTVQRLTVRRSSVKA